MWERLPYFLLPDHARGRPPWFLQTLWWISLPFFCHLLFFPFPLSSVLWAALPSDDIHDYPSVCLGKVTVDSIDDVEEMQIMDEAFDILGFKLEEKVLVFSCHHHWWYGISSCFRACLAVFVSSFQWHLHRWCVHDLSFNFNFNFNYNDISTDGCIHHLCHLHANGTSRVPGHGRGWFWSSWPLN